MLLQIVRHGGSLGLGLAAMGTARQDVYDLLKTNLYQDDAVTGKCSVFKANSHLRPYQASRFFWWVFFSGFLLAA